MFKISNKIVLSSLFSSEKQKKKIWSISAIIMLASLLLIDVINVRTTNRHQAIFLLIKNIYLLVPLALVYLMASRQRDLLKDFIPLYIALMLLVGTIYQGFNDFAQTQNQNGKFEKEIVSIIKEFMSREETFTTNKSSTYSAEEYGQLAIPLNKLRQVMEFCKQESIAVEQAFNAVDLDSIFTDDVLFNFFKIIDKKKKLEQLSIFLDESEKKTEEIHSEYIEWMLFSSDLNEAFRKSFADSHYRTAEEKEFLRREPYKIKKNIVGEFIKLLDFFSVIYGSYERGKNQEIICTYSNDLSILQSHAEKIHNLYKEEENFALLFQQRALQMEKLSK